MRLVAELSGETLAGRYQLAGRVPGGTGDVYLGRDLRLDRPVSVKVLQPPLSEDPQIVADFLAEAGAGARLSHRHILTVYDWDSHEDSTYFMVMEYLPGADLRDLLVAGGTLDPDRAVEIMISVCEALAAAHDRGVTHRGLRPENILVSRFGTVKVSDFGVAAVSAPATAARLQGSLRYLAPEQARGEEATASSDIWTAGAVLAELLSGRPPSPAAGGTIVLDAALGRPAETQTVQRPSKFARGVPRALDAIVERACALDPAARFSTAADMAGALRRALTRPDHAEPSFGAMMDELERRDAELDEPGRLGGALSRARLKRAPEEKSAQRESNVRTEEEGGGVSWRRLVSAGVVIALVGVGAARGVAALLAPHPVRVPTLSGLTVGAAERRAQLLGLETEVTKRRFHKRVPAGLVLAQTKSGTLLEGSSIGLVVSKGLPSKPVPSLAGLPLEGAGARLSEVGMEVGRTTKRFSEEPEGTVIAQAPEGGRLLWGSEVAVTVSLGPSPVQVPEAAGRPFEEAKKILGKAGLEPIPLDAYSNVVARGEVIRTDPEAGRRAPHASQVRVYVSRGPQFPEVRLPDVRNLGVAAATKVLKRANFRVEVVESCGPGGSVVVDTEPVGGAMVREGGLIALFLC